VGKREAKTAGLAAACMLALAAPRGAVAIVGGATETGAGAVVAVSVTFSGAEALCSGVLVAPRVVLTAAACLDPDGPGGAAGAAEVEVFVGGDVSGSGTTIAADEWTSHPSFAGDPAFANLALILLEARAVPAPVPLRPTPLGAADVGAAARVVGFGTSGAVASDLGVKRAFTDSVRALESALLWVGQDGETACAGDSGAPVLMTDGEAEQLVGVVAFSDLSCAGAAAATDVAAYGTWIGAWAAAHAEREGGGGGCGPAAPRSLAGLAVLLLLAWRRRRS
jgi:secreted trypsin-like serine protease